MFAESNGRPAEWALVSRPRHPVVRAGDGGVMLRHACAMGLEGIVSKSGTLGSVGTIAGLGEGQESRRAGCETDRRKRLAEISDHDNRQQAVSFARRLP